MSPRDQMTRGDSLRRRALARSCPSCGALANQRCIGVRGLVRTALHADRIAQAREERPA